MKESKSFVGHAMNHGWLPHKPDTWTHRFARLKSDRTIRHFVGRWEKGNPVETEVLCRAGQFVKIVMVSRFGDVGITDNLEAETGYGARLCMDELYDYQESL